MRALHLVEIASPQQRYQGWYSDRIADVGEWLWLTSLGIV